jgi:hypothetical protein
MMIDQEVEKIANDRVRIEIGEQNRRLRSEIERIKREMNFRGMLHSSTTITSVTSLCVYTLKNRAQLVWQTLFRFITTAGISYSPELADELKGWVAQYLPEKIGDLKGYIKQTAEMTGFLRLHERLGKGLDDGRKQALDKVGTEIDLFVHSLKKNAEAVKGEATSNVFNMYSPMGSIQTGDTSIANVTQNIDTEVKEQIRKSLEEISLALTQPEVETHSPKDELIEVVQETQVEVQKEKPNFTRLRSLLTTIGTSIQMVSSLKPTYEILKQALTFLGIYLP